MFYPILSGVTGSGLATINYKPRPSVLTYGDSKFFRGLPQEEIDGNLVNKSTKTTEVCLCLLSQANTTLIKLLAPLFSTSLSWIKEKIKKKPAAVALERLGGLKGGKARAESLSVQRRKEIARKAAKALWKKKGELRLKSGLTQEAFAEQAKFSYKYYQGIERGQWTNLRLRTIEKLADGYGVRLSKLFGPKNPTPNIKSRIKAKKERE